MFKFLKKLFKKSQVEAELDTTQDTKKKQAPRVRKTKVPMPIVTQTVPPPKKRGRPAKPKS